MDHLIAHDPFDRFVAIQSELLANGDWQEHATWLRFAAITAVMCPLDPIEAARTIRAGSQVLKERSSWYSDMATPLRFAVSALLTVDGIDPLRYAEELPGDHNIFRELAIRHGGQFETMAITILRHFDQGRPMARWRAERLKLVYDAFKQYHWWLTGPDDLPSCACLASLNASPDTIANTVDQIYRLLHRRGYAIGNHLLIASALLALTEMTSELASERFHVLGSAFQASGSSLWREDYHGIAILSQLEQDPALIVERHTDYVRRLAALEPQSLGQSLFDLATSLTTMDLLRCDGRGIRFHQGPAIEKMLGRFHRFTASSLLLTSSAQSLATADAFDWPTTNPLYPLGRGLP